MNILSQILFSKVQMGSESRLGPEQRSPDSHSVSLPQVAALLLAFRGSSSWQEQVPGAGGWGGAMTRCWEGVAGRSGILRRVRRGHWEGRGQGRRSYLLSLLKALTLGLLRSRRCLCPPFSSLSVWLKWLYHKITGFFAFSHILKAKSGFNDWYSVPWYFLSSKGHVIVRYYISMGPFFHPQQTFLSGRF